MLTRGLIAALALGALLSPPAHAAPAWLPPLTFSEEGLQEPFVSVAVAPDGTTVAAWTRQSGENRIVEATRRRAGEAFGPAVMLNDPGENAVSPMAGIDHGGNATVTWAEGPNTRVRVARLPAGAAAFEQPQTLGTGANLSAPAIGVGANGAAVVVFQDGLFGNMVLKAAIRDGASGIFGLAQTVSAPAEFFHSVNQTGAADVAVAPDGTSVLAWGARLGAHYVVQTNVRAPAGVFAPTGENRSSTAPSASGEQPSATIDPAGNATVAWTHVPNTANPGREIRFAGRPAGGAFGAAAVASEPAPVAEYPDLAATADGTVIGTWLSGSGGSRQVRAAFRAPGAASFTAHEPLSPTAGGSLEPRLAASPGGDAVVTWPDADIGGISAAHRLPGGAFGDAREVVGDAGEPAGTQFLFTHQSTAIDDQGNATVLWRFDHFRSGSHFYRVQAAGFDNAPPTLSASVPPTAIAGATVGMAAAALDRWGPVSLSWAFGDGATGAGDAVSHAFGTAGPFDVTVTATDAAGSSTSATRSIAVAAAPPVPLPRIDASVASRWGFDARKRFIFLLRLRVKAPPQGAVAELRCKGRKCPFKRKRVKRIRKNRIDVFKALSERQRRFRPGQRLQLRITAPGHIGKVVKYRLRKGRIPNGRTFCLPPGATKPQKAC